MEKRVGYRVGYSVNQKPIWAKLFGPSPTVHQPLHSLFIGGFHGDEGIGVVLLERWEAWLAEHASQLNKPVATICCLNPDGLQQNTRQNANGVDLNRNFPTQNWQACATEPAYAPGPSAASEPETQALLSFFEQIPCASNLMIISVHAPYRCVNYDGPEALSVATAMAAHNQYPVTADIGYPTPGSFGTWAGNECGYRVVTLELPDYTPDMSPLARQQFERDVWQQNSMAFQAVLALG